MDFLQKLGPEALSKMSKTDLQAALQAKQASIIQNASSAAIENYQTTASNNDGLFVEQEWDCVPMSEDPSPYQRDTKMMLKSGNCGIKYQITNINQNLSFNFQFNRDNDDVFGAGAFQALSVAITSVVVLALF